MQKQVKASRKSFKERFCSAVKLMLLSVSITSMNVIAFETVSFNQAVSRTLEQHPELRAFTYRAEAHKGLVQQAGVSSPISINVDLENVLGSDAHSGFSAMQANIGVSWLLEGDIIDAKVDVANKKSGAVTFEREIKALDLAAETAKYFVTILSQEQQLKLAKIAENQSKELLHEVDLRVKAGKSNVVDSLRAKANLAQKALVVEDLTHEIEASKASLAAQWQSQESFDVQGSLINIPTLEQIESASQQFTSNPRLKLFASQQRIAQSEIALAKATQNPAWEIRTGIKSDQQVDDFSLTAGISIPWGNANRNRGKISSLQAQQSQSQAESEAWQLRVSTQLLLLTHKLRHNIHVVEGLSKMVIPSLKQANKKAKQAYNTGSYRYSDWYAVQQELLMAQVELIDAYTNIQFFNIEIERLTGSSISK